MPIKDPSVYLADWKSVRERILRRATGISGIPRCECTGECGHVHIMPSGRCENYHGMYGSKTYKTVLTLAHLDHDASAGDHSDENLKAFCQGCHLRYDGEHRRAKDSGQERLI